MFVVCALGVANPSRAVTASDGALLTSLVTAAASRDARFDVLSSADVRKAIDTEAQKSIAGCDEDACLAELAEAMGARSVLHGSIGVLGDSTILSLSLFDTGAGVATGRAVVRASSVGAVGDRVDDAVGELLARVPMPPSGRVRVLVLDLDVVGARVEPAGGLASLGIACIVSVGVGAVGLAVGAGCDGLALDADARLKPDRATRAVDIPDLIARRDAAIWVGRVAWIAGGALVVGGGTALIVDLLGEA